MSHKEWEGRRARKRVRTWVRSELAVKKPRDEKDDKDKQDEEDDHEEVASKNRKDNPKTTDEGSTPVDDFNTNDCPVSTMKAIQIIVFQLPMNVLSIVVQQAKVFRIQMSEELMKIGTKELLGINQRVVIPSGLYPLYDRYSQNGQESKSVRDVPDWGREDFFSDKSRNPTVQ